VEPSPTETGHLEAEGDRHPRATCQPTIMRLVASRRETSATPSVLRTSVGSETLRVGTGGPGERDQKRRRHHGVCCRRYPPVAPVAPDPGHLHEPGQLVPRDLVAARLAARLAAMTFANDMSVWIPLPEKFACSRAQPEDSEEDYACVPKRSRRVRCAPSPRRVSLRDGPVARVDGPARLGSVVMAPPSTHKEALQGERRRHRAEPRS